MNMELDVCDIPTMGDCTDALPEASEEGSTGDRNVFPNGNAPLKHAFATIFSNLLTTQCLITWRRG